ncbi:MAG: exo-alpha-sialidase [Planctomycetia bacterium]|nr:exo-alpha-sialidase [Planctomycetia bacterium]
MRFSIKTYFNHYFMSFSCLKVILVLSFIVSGTSAYGSEKDGKGIVFLGDSITQGGTYLAGTVAGWRYQLFKNYVDNEVPFFPMGMTDGDNRGTVTITHTPIYRGHLFKNVSEAAASARSYQYSGHPENSGNVLGVSQFKSDPGTVRKAVNRGPVCVKLGLVNPYTGTANTYYDGGRLVSYTGETYMSRYGDLRPEKLCVLIGINDIYDGGDKVRETVRWVREIVQTYQTYNPNIEIHVFKLLPTGKNNGTGAKSGYPYKKYNEYLQSLNISKAWSTKTSKVFLHDISKGFYAKDGSMVDGPGGAHPTAQGELIIAGNVARVLGVGQRTCGFSESVIPMTELESQISFISNKAQACAKISKKGESERVFTTADVSKVCSLNSAKNLVIKEKDSAQAQFTAKWFSSVEATKPQREFVTVFKVKMNPADKGETVTKLTKKNRFSISCGNGKDMAGTLEIGENAVYWNGSVLLYGTNLDIYGSETLEEVAADDPMTGYFTKEFHEFRIVHKVDPDGNASGGYYVWLNDQLIGENLSGKKVSDAQKDVLTYGNLSGENVCFAEIAGAAFQVSALEENVVRENKDSGSEAFVNGTADFNDLRNVSNFTEILTEVGTLTASGGALGVYTGNHAVGGTALQLKGNKQGSFTLTFPRPLSREKVLEFLAERWTNNNIKTKTFLVYALVEGEEKQIFDGSEKIVAGNMAAQSVPFSAKIPAGTGALVFKWETNVPGYIIDEVTLKDSPENFSSLKEGMSVTTFKMPMGTLSAKEGSVKAKKNHVDDMALHLLGDEKNDKIMRVNFPEATQGESTLSFEAWRLSEKKTFSFSVFAINPENVSKKIFDGSDVISGKPLKAAPRFFMSVPSETKALLFRWKTPAEAGIILDHLLLEEGGNYPACFTDYTVSTGTWPVLKRFEQNAVMKITVTCAKGGLHKGTQFVFDFSKTNDLADIKKVELYTSLTENADLTTGATLVSEAAVPDTDGKVTLEVSKDISHVKTVSYFLSVTLSDDANIDNRIAARLISIKCPGDARAVYPSGEYVFQRMGIVLARGGDSVIRGNSQKASNNFAIPGIAAGKGRIVAVFDARYRNATDLAMSTPIDVASIVSKDGGKTWGKIRLAQHWTWEGKEDTWETGVGDPAILFDPAGEGTFWVAGLTGRGIRTSTKAPAQIILSRSTDGENWSGSVQGTTYDDITSQVKHDSWKNCIFQGPGHGITMRDGTLVFPTQIWSTHGVSDGGAYANIIYSKDNGVTWRCEDKENNTKGNGASKSTESTVAELSTDGVLMLNARNQTGNHYRTVHTSSDYGKTWTQHPTHANTLVEPGACQGSLLSVQNICAGEVANALFFSNPASAGNRSKMTIKLSLDDGKTWVRSLLYDERQCAGYSDICMADDEYVGIIYECLNGRKHLAFIRIPVKDLLPKVISVSQ